MTLPPRHTDVGGRRARLRLRSGKRRRRRRRRGKSRRGEEREGRRGGRKEVGEEEEDGEFTAAVTLKLWQRITTNQRDTVHSPTITTMPFSANRAVRVMGRSTQGSCPPCATRGKWRYGNKRRLDKHGMDLSMSVNNTMSPQALQRVT